MKDDVAKYTTIWVARLLLWSIRAPGRTIYNNQWMSLEWVGEHSATCNEGTLSKLILETAIYLPDD